MLSFLVARDTMHQNQWLAAIEELEKDGLGGAPVPITFPQEREFREVSYKIMGNSEGTQSAAGRRAEGPSIDGRGELQYESMPEPYGPAVELGKIDPRVHGTPKAPGPPQAAD